METDEPEVTETSSEATSPDPTGTSTDEKVEHEDIGEWRGKDLIDRNGERIGKLEDVYFDIETDQPQFGTVKEGFIDRHLTFVPLTAITIGPESLRVAVTRQQVKEAPSIEQEGDELTPA
jgi:sporulation protein YlmC with PRC-barrel domain